MFTTVGIIICAIFAVGGITALAILKPTLESITAILPFIIYVSCIAFIFFIAFKLLQLILNAPGKKKDGRQIKSVEYYDTRKVSGDTSKAIDSTARSTTRPKQLTSGKSKSKSKQKKR